MSTRRTRQEPSPPTGKQPQDRLDQLARMGNEEVKRLKVEEPLIDPGLGTYLINSMQLLENAKTAYAGVYDDWQEYAVPYVKQAKLRMGTINLRKNDATIHRNPPAYTPLMHTGLEELIYVYDAVVQALSGGSYGLYHLRDLLIKILDQLISLRPFKGAYKKIKPNFEDDTGEPRLENPQFNKVKPRTKDSWDRVLISWMADTEDWKTIKDAMLAASTAWDETKHEWHGHPSEALSLIHQMNEIASNAGFDGSRAPLERAKTCFAKLIELYDSAASNVPRDENALDKFREFLDVNVLRVLIEVLPFKRTFQMKDYSSRRDANKLDAQRMNYLVKK